MVVLVLELLQRLPVAVVAEQLGQEVLALPLTVVMGVLVPQIASLVQALLTLAEAVAA